MKRLSTLFTFSKSLIACSICVALLMLFAGCTGDHPIENKLKEEEAYIFGLETYVYGFPLVEMDLTRAVITAAPNAGEYAAPINQFTRLHSYVSPDFKNVVRISLSSLWTTGFVDLDQEPWVLTVPETHGRYYAFNFFDMWTNVFGAVGKRNTGTSPGAFLIAGPKWNGTPPANIKQVFRCPTRYTWILGQTQANGPKDFAPIIAIENQYTLTPLSVWGKPYTPPSNVPVDPNANASVTPYDQIHQMDAATFYNRLAVLMKDNPPYDYDGKALEKMKKLGIEPGQPFDINKADPAVRDGLNRAMKDGWGKLAEGTMKMKNVDGWIYTRNLGHFGTDYDLRAGVAWLGLGANQKEDTMYPSAFVDGDGHPLDYTAKYTMHFDKGQLPPTNATWSLAVYKGNFYDRNAINRNDLAPWMPLKFNSDGSIDFYLQPDSPGKDKEANWLPSPTSGPLNYSVRVYWSKEPLLDGSYHLPPIKKVQQ